jgi:transposase
MNRDYFWLSKQQFARLEPLLPSDPRGKPRVDDHRVISGIIHVIKSGGRWVDAPPVYGPTKTLYNRFQRLVCPRGVEQHLPCPCQYRGPSAQLLIASSAVRAHRCAAGGKRGSRSRLSVDPEADAPPKSTP